MTLSRRGFITGLSAIIAAPAIVRVSSIMPVRALIPDPYEILIIGRDEYCRATRFRELLMPGLLDITTKYEIIPAEWDRMFQQTA